MSPTIHHVIYDSELYEFLLIGTVIQRITRYQTDSRMEHDLSFEDLPKRVQDDLISQLLEENGEK